jgi:hypothetical protein
MRNNRVVIINSNTDKLVTSNYCFDLDLSSGLFQGVEACLIKHLGIHNLVSLSVRNDSMRADGIIDYDVTVNLKD